MRIINSTSSGLTFTDFDRGNVGESRGVYEYWNAKSFNGVAASGFIDVFDTEDVLLSAEMGQIKKYADAGWITTLYSVVGTAYDTFTIVTGVNDTFDFILEGYGTQTATLPAGELTTAQVISAISDSASGVSGFSAESVSFFRSSQQDNTELGEVDGGLATGYGQRTEGIIDGFIALVCDVKITIRSGNANATLGFNAGDFTKVG